MAMRKIKPINECKLCGSLNTWVNISEVVCRKCGHRQPKNNQEKKENKEV